MAGYLLHRLLGARGVLFAMSVLIFAIVHILPGNVAYAILGEYATPDAVATLQARLGLNDPLWLQYWRWLSGVLHGEMGQSLVMDRPAGPLIAEALGRSAILAGSAFCIVAAGGIALGVHAATHQGRVSDRVLTLAQFVFIAVPDFFRGLDSVLGATSLDDLKAYLRWHLVHGEAAFLSQAFVNEDFRFFRQILTGAKELQPRWKRCVSAVDGDLGFALAA